MAYQDFGNDGNAMREQMIIMGQFQLLHNELRKDFATLYVITAQRLQQGIPAPEMIRACLKELFSLIESDLYYLNFINPYVGYHYKADFFKKFKKTYRQHCRTHGKLAAFDRFYTDHYGTFRSLKKKRDELMHPKGAESIKAEPELFEVIYEFFKQYVDFVGSTMQGVGVQWRGKTVYEFFDFMGENS